jgi:hypothetical protein
VRDLGEDGDAVVVLSRAALTIFLLSVEWYDEKLLWRRTKRTFIEPKPHNYSSYPKEDCTETDSEDEEDIHRRRVGRLELRLVHYVDEDLIVDSQDRAVAEGSLLGRSGCRTKLCRGGPSGRLPTE